MTELVDGFDNIGIFFDLDNLRLHCQFTKDILEKEQTDFKKRFDKNLKELQGDARINYQEWQSDNHFYLFDVFPSLQWLSLFNTAYSVFEKNMNYICRLAWQKTNSNIQLKDLHGQGIERAKLYLNKVAGIVEPFESTLWQKVRRYADLRNVMVHATGELDLSNGNHKKVLEFALSHPKIKVIQYTKESEPSEIQLEPEIVLEAIEDFRGFLALLSDQNIKE
jgi:hypothetical protein